MTESSSSEGNIGFGSTASGKPWAEEHSIQNGWLDILQDLNAKKQKLLEHGHDNERNNVVYRERTRVSVENSSNISECLNKNGADISPTVDVGRKDSSQVLNQKQPSLTEKGKAIHQPSNDGGPTQAAPSTCILELDNSDENVSYEDEGKEAECGEKKYFRISLEDPKRFCKGSMIEIQRGFGLYKHFGICIGGGDVIHFTLDIRRLRVIVKKDKLFNILKPNTKVRVHDGKWKDIEPLPPEEIVERALQKLGQGGFHPWKYNCEHLARECRYGVAASEQVERIKSFGWYFLD